MRFSQALRAFLIINGAFAFYSSSIVLLFAQSVPEIKSVPIPLEKPSVLNDNKNTNSKSASSASMTKVATTKDNDAIIMSLSDAVFLALRNNRQIKSAYINRISQRYDLKVAEDRFTPHFSIDGSLSRQRIAGVHTDQYDISPGVSALTPVGTQFNFVWNFSGTDSDNSNSFSNLANLSINQPLLRGAGYEVNMAPVNVARLNERINRLRLKTNVSETIVQIIFAHRDLIQAQEELRLANESVKRVHSMLEQNRLLIKTGRMAEMDSVQTEADLENQRIRVLQAQRTLDSSRLNLLDLLNLELSTKLIAKEEFNLRQIPLDVPKLFEIALAERQDYQSQLLTIEQNKIGIKVAENAQLWDVSLFAQGTYGTRSRFMTPDERVTDGSFGIKFSIPLNDLSRKQQLVQADVQNRTGELQLDILKSGIEKQIRTSASEVTIYWEQSKTAETQLKLAQQALDTARLKLNAGRSSAFEVQTQEQNLRNAETQLVNSKLNYLNALTRLDLQLGTTLETWQISLNDRT